ncbi:MAG: response regulator [Butyrivibrio sp.]|nr:response regulator [Butyrivibrio sp.]
MRKVLVVEDEKLIRQGIATMIKRCGVPVEEVIECANGLQALEVLKEQTIDVCFTDIRMPKMNGIELVKAMKEFGNPPLSVAVSGYDDFTYAVEMMRQGVREYILKPVERDKLKAIMEKLDEEISQKLEDEKKTEHAGRQLIKYLLMDDEASENELELISKNIRDTAGDTFYCMIAAGSDTLMPYLDDQSAISGPDGMDIFILGKEKVEELKSIEGTSSFAGLSDVCSDSKELKRAYKEALLRRENAFCRKVALFSEDRNMGVAQSLLESGKKLCEKEAVAARVQLIGTSRSDDLEKEWNAFFTSVQRGQIIPEDFRSAMDEFAAEYLKVYQKEVDSELLMPFSFLTIEDYRQCFMDFARRASAEHQQPDGADQTRLKIQEAINYIKENYKTDINMAVVSNEVSMNYSLFSSAFKNYTGTNFVGFVRDLRIGEAKKLLATTPLKVNEISARVGYDNEKHFMKSFKAIVGVSPSEYRKNMGADS